VQLVVVGAGLVGLAAAREIRRRRPDVDVLVLEKERGVARHQSSHNSGVLHAGLYYRPGSDKARLAVRGIRMMVTYCEAQGIAFERCGKLVVAVDQTEVPRLKTLFERGQANGLTGLRWLTAGEAHAIEPEVRCVAAVQVPEEGIVDYPAVASALADDIRDMGGEVRTGVELAGARRNGAGWRLATNGDEHHADFVLTCAGLHADRVARLFGVPLEARIVPFRGDYFKLKGERAGLVRHLVYPVPNPAFPFLGVHFTRMIGGGVECGPSAVLAFKREGYRRSDFSLADTSDSLRFPGLWRFLARHPRMVAGEFVRSASMPAFTRSLQRMIPAVQAADLEPGGSGVRAQAMTRDGRLVEDFLFQDGPDSLHVINAPSPAATASLAIGEQIADRIGRRLS
jgi:(S)-2-hydroxyglutarate dehydrogenase